MSSNGHGGTWGSDVIADTLRATGVDYISLNPGASYRGLHDSLVNHLGNERPKIVLCLHEEHAVAIAHGYAKVSGRPMAVALHSNVGLMHATMALYNAYCDRVPMLVLGATGPWDAARRRPWIDWIHTSGDQGALVRAYTKWDDQPGSVPAALESIARGDAITRGYPSAPVYVCLDVTLQETDLPEPIARPDLNRLRPPPPPAPDPGGLDRAVELLRGARKPLVLIGRVGRSVDAWERRVQLVERLGANVLTDLKVGSSFPTEHPRHAAPPAAFLRPDGVAALQAADVVLALDWIDLGGTLRQAFGRGSVGAQVISCTSDHALHNGWSKDHFELPVADVPIATHPDMLVDALLERFPATAPAIPSATEHPAPTARVAADRIDLPGLAAALRAGIGLREACLVRVPLGWRGDEWPFRHPLDFLGSDGGGGLGSGPGMAVGAALALRSVDRLPVAVLGDGDFLMGATALWTAAHLRLPLLVVVANNGTYLNDEIHQEQVARTRGRVVENRWIGQRIGDPRPDLAQMARSMGLTGYGPVDHVEDLDGVIADAVGATQDGPVVVDVQIAASSYNVGAQHERAAGPTRA